MSQKPRTVLRMWRSVSLMLTLVLVLGPGAWAAGPVDLTRLQCGI